MSGLDGFFGLRGEWLDLRGTSSNPSNGIHPSPVLAGQAEGAGLARHYEEMKPDAFVTFGPVNKCLASCPPPCFNMDLTAVLRWCPHCTKRPVGWMYPSQPWDFMLAKNAAGNWDFAMPSGTMQDVSSFVDAEVLYRLNDSGLRFVAASEPFAAQGAPQATAQAVFALADGRGIHAGVFANEGFFAYDRSLELTSGISARMGAAFVYSRALATLFVIGGEAGGSLTREIWMHRIGVGTELLDTSEYRPEYVWAAQAASDGTLWVLDSPTQAANTRRLSRIHVPSAAAHVVWSGVRDGSFTEYVLRADREGSMLLFSASASDYCTLRWRAQSYELGTELPVLMRNDTGTLRGPPSVHPAGYQFLLESGRDNFMRQDVAELVDQFGGSPPVSRCL